MTLYDYTIVFPNGEQQKANRPLAITGLYDVNGKQLIPPLSTNKMIAYRISRKQVHESCGIVTTTYQFEQLTASELLEYIS